RIATLDLVKLGDVALEVGIYQQAVLEQISWLDNEQDKIALLSGVLDKVRAYDGEFISTVLTDVVDLLDTVLFQFPGIDTNNDGITDISLSEFLDRINEMTVILNKDPEYHSWFQGALSKVSDLALLEVGFNPIVDFGVNMLASGDNAFTEAELELLYEVIEQNFSTNQDLKRELQWLAGVYQKIAELNIAADLQNGAPVQYIVDAALETEAGRHQFKTTIEYFLEGQLISATTAKL